MNGYRPTWILKGNIVNMKIAYILSSLENAGPIVVAYELVQQLIKHDHTVEVFYFDDKIDLDFPCPIHKISMWKQFKFHNYDLVHCHGLRPDLFVLLHKPMFCKTPVVTTIHSYMFSDHAFKYGKWQSKITARLVLASTIRDDKIILLSKHMMDYYSHYLPAKKLTYAYNSRLCDLSLKPKEDDERNILEFKGNSILLCSVSGLNPRKGLHQIIQALPLLPDFKYYIVGDGKERQFLQELAQTLEVADRVLFVGRKSAGFRFLHLADIFVMPSYSEGFPLAMLEAASMQKVIVCSDMPVFREIFSDKEITTFELDNTNSLRDALLTAHREKEKLAANVHQKYLESYSPECFYHRHHEIYQSLVESKSKIKHHE